MHRGCSKANSSLLLNHQYEIYRICSDIPWSFCDASSHWIIYMKRKGLTILQWCMALITYSFQASNVENLRVMHSFNYYPSDKTHQSLTKSSKEIVTVTYGSFITFMFSQNIYNKHPIAVLWRWDMAVFCEFYGWSVVHLVIVGLYRTQN